MNRYSDVGNLCQFNVGDVVKTHDGRIAVVTNDEDELLDYVVLYSDGDAHSMKGSWLEGTGKAINVKAFLAEISA